MNELPKLSPHFADMRRWADNSLFYFATQVLRYDKLVQRIHEPVALRLMDESITRLNQTMPRKFFKTTLCSIAYSLWKPCARNINHTMLLAMNTVDNAKPKLMEIKQHVESNQIFRATYPEVIPDFSKTQWGAERATLRRTGLHGTPTWTLAGATSAVVSGAFDELTLDDLLTANEGDGAGETVIPGKKDIDRAIRWVKKSISLLNDPLHGRINNVGTRWAENDLVAYVLKWIRGFSQNDFQLHAVNGLEIATDQDGFFEIVGGTATMPEVYPIEALNIILQQQGSTLFRLWYQNEPIDPAEIIFNLDGEANYFQPLQHDDEWLDGLRKYTAVDLAYSDGEKSDNTAIVTIGVDENGVRYVLDLQYGKFMPLDTVERLFNLYERYKMRVIGLPKIAAEVLMEKFLPHFMRERDTMLPVKAMPRGGEMRKENRIIAGIQPWVEQRMLKLARVDCIKPLEVEMRDFRIDRKRSGKRDALDALTDALELSREKNIEITPEPKHKYDHAFMQGIRNRLYSAEDDIEKTLRDDEMQRHVIGRRLSYMN